MADYEEIKYIDSHCHFLEMSKKGIDDKIVIRDIFNSNISACLDIGIKSDDIKERIKYREMNNKIFLAAGLYPSVAEENIDEETNKLEKNIAAFRKDVFAIGECGLDFHWDFATPELQQKLLENQFELARKFNLPLIIHCRNADKQLVQFLTGRSISRESIIHCFSSDKDYARKYLDAGFFISFAGNVTYKKSTDLQEACKYIPSDRLLLETDSPYLSPGKMRGKLNNPSNIELTYNFVAQLRNQNQAELALDVEKNFYRIIK